MLFKKLFLFAAIFLLAQQLLHYFFIQKQLPVFWGNGEIASKMQYIQEHGDVNAVFVGSSKVKRQVMPEVFDSVLNDGTKSFNLGCNGLFIPESFTVLDYLLDSTAIKKIFFELRPVYHIYPENLHISRTIYYHTPKSYLNTLNIAMHSNLPLGRKANAYTTYSIAEAENLINFNLTDGLINYKNYDYAGFQQHYDINGGCFTMGQGPGQPLLQSHSELDERAALAERYMEQYKADGLNNLTHNQPYLNEMLRLAAKAKQKKVKLVLVFPTALREFEYREIFPMLKELSFLPQLNMASPKEYPELYTVENNYETDHLNAKGARVYSIDLAEAYKKAIKQN